VTSISGGWLWHWRALRRRSRWEPTCQQIDAFHRSYGPRSGTLLLLGCSAGWMLGSAWLQGFERIVAVDFDRLAPFFFRICHPRVARPLWIHVDALAHLDQLLAEFPDACVLFDNMLGQQGLIASDKGRDDAASLQSLEKDLGALKFRLEGRCWGSLHDCISGPVRKTFTAFRPAPREKAAKGAKPAAGAMPAVGAMPALDAMPAAGAMPALASEGPLGSKVLFARMGDFGAAEPYGEWLDHLSASIFPPTLARNYLLWPFSASYWHWLEIAWVGVDSPSVQIGKIAPTQPSSAF